MIKNILELRKVTKKLDKFTLDDVSFALPKGYIMGFVGQNGAGKTTTIKLILNMLKKDSGEIITIDKEKIGVVMDSPFFVDEWKLKEIGGALKPFYTNWDNEKFNRMLSDFSLDAEKKVKELSRGMKMKIMVAVAMSHGAELLILDEPTSGLDAVARNELMDILKNFINDENKSVLFSTHITTDLEKIADYITFISNGKILYTGTKDDLLEKYALIKGGADILSAEQKGIVIGYQETSVNFDGVIEKSKIKKFPKEIIIEPCSLDELVIRFNKGGN